MAAPANSCGHSPVGASTDDSGDSRCGLDSAREASVEGAKGAMCARFVDGRVSDGQAASALPITVATPAPTTRGVGLTPRLCEALLGQRRATLKSLSGAYVPAIGTHVQSAGTSKQVMARYWCPIVVESEGGTREVLHADPLVVRQFRRTIAEELKHVQEKRRRMLRRIQAIRQHLPAERPEVMAARLRREIASAEAKADEPLMRPLPQGTRVLHVLIETSPNMIQLDLACQSLAQELPEALRASDAQFVTLTAIVPKGAGAAAAGVGAGITVGHGAVPRALEEPLTCAAPLFEEVLRDWFSAVASSRPLIIAAMKKNAKRSGKGGDSAELGVLEAARAVTAELRVAPALRRLADADALGPGGAAALLIACTPPVDTEAAVEILRRSGMTLQIVGVYGLSPEDPETAFERLTDAASPGSVLRFFFGPVYWARYIAAQQSRLDALGFGGEDAVEAPDGLAEDGVSSGVLEMRMIERIMRECYVEEQRCEEELRCAGNVLARTLVAPEDVAAAMRPSTRAAIADHRAVAADLVVSGGGALPA